MANTDDEVAADMGYYSEVALVIKRTDPAAPPLTEVWQNFTGPRMDMWKDEVTEMAKEALVTEDRWVLTIEHCRWVKTLRDVAYVLRWMRHMRDLIDDDGTTYAMTFVRIGEMYEDTSLEYWGDRNARNIYIQRTISGAELVKRNMQELIDDDC